MPKFKNKKSGDIYIFLVMGTDCTNTRDGLPVVIYYPENQQGRIFVREEKEFYEKFEPVE